MKIEILGTGCSRCKTLEKNLRKAVEELNIQADILKAGDIQKMIEYGILAAPALVVNGEVKCSGSTPDIEKIKEWLK